MTLLLRWASEVARRDRLALRVCSLWWVGDTDRKKAAWCYIGFLVVFTFVKDRNFIMPAYHFLAASDDHRWRRNTYTHLTGRGFSIDLASLIRKGWMNMWWTAYRKKMNVKGQQPPREVFSSKVGILLIFIENLLNRRWCQKHIRLTGLIFEWVVYDKVFPEQ